MCDEARVLASFSLQAPKDDALARALLPGPDGQLK